MTRRVLVARLDSLGDVILAGPAVRAVAASPEVDEVWMLCSSIGAPAAELLPGVTRVIVWDCPWITAAAPPVTARGLGELERALLAADGGFDAAVILTSFHQSPLPLAVQLRLAGVPRITAASTDFGGSLLDVRLKPGEDFSEDLPEPERALLIARAAGFALPEPDDGRLRLRVGSAERCPIERPFVVVHPGASASARRWPADGFAAVVEALGSRGIRVVVTGTSAERDLTSTVAGRWGTDAGGDTPLPALAALLRRASVLISGNTGPAHVAAAVGTPVVSLFSPVVPAIRWAPYGVASELLGDQEAACAGTRATECPVPGHPCLTSVTPDDVVAAVLRLSTGLVASTEREVMAR